ncbi:UNVERIFIED_CONTAM: Retrovirus-related Pol polyprotein from type-2 retrotransposable element R2DM, partial [Sesamum latifolium]
RLLKQVNSTLISLIPKVNNPTVVGEFRPISCCNVLYKIITKILVQRMRGILDMLRLPPRCALKVDLRKAYDTVEWDFLRAVLTLFGFPEQFIGWIVETPHGYFRGARGLRQGDPMSPYLFVLVMEVLSLILRQVIDQDGGFSYHWKCGEMQLCQLGFADDLLLFSKADTGSVQEGHLPLGIWVYLSSPPDCLLLTASRSSKKLIVVLVVGMELHCHLLGTLKGVRQGVLATGLSPVSEGGLGIRDLQALNKGLMSRHLWRVITADRSSIWVDWIFHYRLRDLSVWTVSDRTGSWGWRKMVRLRDWLRPFVHYKVGDGTSFSLWHDPWHPLGPLISQFPLGPRHTSLPDSALLHGADCIRWTGRGGSFSSAAAYDVYCPPGPQVGWSSLLVGTFKIPRHRFILWLAILGRLSTLDKPWLQRFGTSCVLCPDALPESHDHLFFACSFANDCLRVIRREVSIRWPYTSWPLVIQWASVRWRGKHVANASFRALLASLVYHLWLERNRRIFQNTTRSPNEIARIIVSEIRELIICKQLPSTVSTRGLYRLWRIPWPVEGEADT